MDEVTPTRLRTPRRRRIWPHKLWLKLFQARRRLRITMKTTSSAAAAWLKEKEELIDRYERQIALERARFDDMQRQLISSVVTIAGQPAIVTSDLDEATTDPRYRREPDREGSLEDTLSDEAYQLYLDRYDDFKQEGLEQGMSPAQIKLKWSEVKDRAVEDAANSVI